MVPVTDPEILGRMTPDFSAITRLSLEKECIGIHAFSPAKETDLIYHAEILPRFYGIDEGIRHRHLQ